MKLNIDPQTLRDAPNVRVSFAMDCAICGISIPDGEMALAIRLPSGIAGVTHIQHRRDAAVIPPLPVINAHVPPPGGGPFCPVCGTNRNPKTGAFFHETNAHSLGNHKRAHTRAGERRESFSEYNGRRYNDVAVSSEEVAPKAEEMAPKAEPVAPRPPAEPVILKRGGTTTGSQPVARVNVNTLPSGYLDALELKHQMLLADEAAKPDETLFFSPEGLEVIEQMEYTFERRIPTCLIGGTGLGKTVVASYVSAKGGQPFTLSTNLTPATRIEQLVGMPILSVENGATKMEWSPGIVDLPARYGGTVVLEEVTRSNETMSRLFSLTDQMGRGLPEPENPFEPFVPVHPNFWLVATGNPVRMGMYQTTEMDAALKSRFFFISAEKPLADEPRLIEHIMGKGHPKLDQLLDFFSEVRFANKVFPATRDLVMAAQLISDGMPFRAAIEGAVVYQFSKEAEGLRLLLGAYA